MHLGFIDSVFFVNDQLTDIKDMADSEMKVKKAVYEVFRVVAGKPLFIDGHIKRLKSSLNKSGIDFYGSEPEMLKKRVSELCEANNKHFGNIELRVALGEDGSVRKYLGFISHSYPEATAYLQGIATKTLNVMRKNPTVKAKNSDARKLANDFLAEHQLYEVLLVNAKYEFTEGSRSNLFFIKADKVYTAPDHVVLQGITRMKVLQALKNLNIEVITEAVNLNNLPTFQSAFICGTSPGVLPLNRINEQELDVSNRILRNIILEYNNIVNSYLSE